MVLQISTLFLAFLVSLLATGGPVMGAAAGQMSAVSGSVFYLHYKSELYRSENASVILLEEANLSPPVGSTPQAVEVAAAIPNATTIFGSVWIGTVAWINQPLSEPTEIHGPVIFTVWLSSNDPTPTFSGVGAGIAVIDQQNRTVGDYVYAYSYARGKVLTLAPKEYEFSVDFGREIAAGERLVFAVGVGSTTRGWQMSVYFDAAQYASRVQLPSEIFVVSEFQQGPVILTTVVAMTVSLSLMQGRRRHLSFDSQSKIACLHR